MKAPQVDRETAEQEIESWLDAKKIFPSTREDSKDAIETLIEAVMYGVLTYNKDEQHKLTHQLQFPLGEEGLTVATFEYKHRINDKILQKYMKGVSGKDGDARINATLAALTGQPRGIIEGLDTIDKKVANAIVVFFF